MTGVHQTIKHAIGYTVDPQEPCIAPPFFVALPTSFRTAGANPAALDSDRFSPLMRAAAAGQHVAMEPLLTSAVNVLARDALHGRSVGAPLPSAVGRTLPSCSITRRDTGKCL